MTKDNVIKKNLTDSQRRAIYQSLLKKSINGKLPIGSMTDLAHQFSTSRRTISRIWKRGRETSTNLFTPGNVDGRKKGN